MSNGISIPPTDGDKRAEVLCRLADAEVAASRAAQQLEVYERMVINQRDVVAQADELCNSLRKEVTALLRHLEGADAPSEPPIAALSPAPSEGDALAEVEIPEGFVKWEGAGCVSESDWGKPVTLFYADGTRFDTLLGVLPKSTSRLEAYRIISAPSEEAGKGEDAPEIPEGFTKWEGGECPVEGDAKVDVILGSGMHGFHQRNRQAGSLQWTHDGTDGDIIAYRVLPSEPAAEANGGADPAANLEYDPEDSLDSDEPALIHFHGGSSFSDTETFTIAASEQHAEESAACSWVSGPQVTLDLPPLFPPEPPQPTTPEQLEAVGVIDGEAGWWGRKLTKERA